MARKRMARPDEIERGFEAAVQRIFAAINSKGVAQTIKKRLMAIEAERRTWEYYLAVRKMPLKQRCAALTPNIDGVREHLRGVRVSAEDLKAYTFEAIAAALEGKPVDQMTYPAETFRAFERLGRLPSVRRFKRAFEEAFRLQTEAGKSGKRISAATLARRLTSYEFGRNPESAVRAMQQGLARVRAEHKRCLKDGIPSPFLEGTESESN